ncbi:PE family protein [Nocardia veterana]|uniref:PE family protein n=1 Tax=Nocardia veterana TaxID=132249 RepID=A0A7X6M227_9NOCA|nr:PE family protein [Nocardia veterana]NKY88781.1 PE family protein [Nocardia veterana]
MALSGVELDGVRFDAAAASAAARRLDSLADRLEAGMRADEAALTVAPAAVDEVSVRAAQTMNQVAASYSDSAAAGILELRKLAATVRSQTGQFARSEDESVAEFGGAV